MRFQNELTDAAALRELGRRVARQRLERDLTQADLAREAGVDRTALQRLETGHSITLTTLLRLLRALGMLENLETVLPAARPGPIELLETQGRPRRRARGPEIHRRVRDTGGWTGWGDEQ
jgi:transcriptional regulator with XRE-family HTH domain